MNKTILMGRLVKDPDLKFATGSGTAVCKFTVAVNRFKKEDGADFINCVAFNKTAETIAQYMVKGSQILLEGSMQTGSYEKEDGTKVYTTDVLVNRFEFAGSKKEHNNNESVDMTPDDGDIPF